MSNTQNTDEVGAEAVKQLLDHGFKVADVAPRIGVPQHTLYDWI